MKDEEYLKALKKLQLELVAMQEWVKRTGARVVVLFEGRDAAGKGGIIKTISQKVSARVFRVVALPAPNDRERTQVYFQRYFAHMPAAGEVVLFDRSWYNRAGVETVMGFCTDEERKRFLKNAPGFERYLVDDGIILIKYWLEVSSEEQEKRFKSRIKEPVKQWKLSGMDLESRRRWYAYSRARDSMLDATDTEHCPWHIVRSNDKESARLNCITHLLKQVPYEPLPEQFVKLPSVDTSDEYDDEKAMKNRNWIPEEY